MALVRTRRIARVAVALALLASTGCATLQFAPSESAVNRTIALIESGSAAELSDISTVPFIFDAEILLRRQEVGSLWAGLKQQGFALEGARLLSLDPVSGDSYLLFSSSEEMAIHFSKHVRPKEHLARIATDRGEFVILLGRSAGRLREIRGIRGPL